MRRQPLESPTHTLLVGLNLGQRGPRDYYKCHVAMREMPVSAVEMIRQVRTALATLIPPGTQHEVIDDQLTPSVEKIGQSLFSARPMENIFFFDPDPGKFPSMTTHLVAQPRQFLFA